MISPGTGHLSDRAVDRVGLRPGEQVRFRHVHQRRWQVGSLKRVEVDGSITLHDRDGAARSHRPESVMVRRPGPRGRLTWQTISDVAVTWEQLTLFDDQLGSRNSQHSDRKR